jgi:lysozyme family protein
LTNIVAITAANAKRWQVAKIVPKRQAEVNGVVVRLVAPAAKARYQEVSKAVWATPGRWPVVAVILEREAGGRWDRQLGQGDPWRKSRSMPPWARALPQSSGRWSGA